MVKLFSIGDDIWINVEKILMINRVYKDCVRITLGERIEAVDDLLEFDIDDKNFLELLEVCDYDSKVIFNG